MEDKRQPKIIKITPSVSKKKICPRLYVGLQYQLNINATFLLYL